MPDGARLVGAITLAITAFLLCAPIMEVYEEVNGTTNFGWFVEVNILLGILVGWISVGKRAGRGISAAITNGVTGVFLLVLWGLLVQAINEMSRLAMKNRYDGPFEAIAAIFEIGSGWGLLLLDNSILVIMVVGALVVGLLTEFAWRVWR